MGFEIGSDSERLLWTHDWPSYATHWIPYFSITFRHNTHGMEIPVTPSFRGCCIIRTPWRRWSHSEKSLSGTPFFLLSWRRFLIILRSAQQWQSFTTGALLDFGHFTHHNRPTHFRYNYQLNFMFVKSSSFQLSVARYRTSGFFDLKNFIASSTDSVGILQYTLVEPGGIFENISSKFTI